MGNYDSWKANEPDPHPPCNAGARDLRLDECDLCRQPVYASMPGHKFCRQHHAEHTRKAIAEMVASRQQGAA
jgi:hypothetical protein